MKIFPRGKQHIGREKKSKMKRYMLLVIMFLICMVGILGLTACRPRGMSKARASQIFRQYVLDPIPASVTNIRAHQPGIFYGSKYTLRFNINRDDLALLVNSRPFIKVWDVKYKNGILYWGWGCVEAGPLVIPEAMAIPKYGCAMSLYGRAREPAWFRPELWDNPESYGLYKIGDLVNTEVFERDKEKSSKLRGRHTTQVLLYNEKEGEAYFIASDWSH